MYLRSLELTGFKSFGKKSTLDFTTPITAIVGPNGSGKSNTAEAFRFVLGEQSMKSLRGKRGEDLIWGGSTELPRANRASIKATFDNASVAGKRLLDVDFDEVVVERVVYRDGTNEYLINGSKVRLKDVNELLAEANIGSSGHHIISQGKADRVLAASSRERKQMIEDALGLRVYQYKKEESLKKLEKTEENKAQVEALRRENAPHLKFLERQMKKLEKARELRQELTEAYQSYLKREESYLSIEHEQVAAQRTEPLQKLHDAENRVKEIRQTLEQSKAGDKESEEILMLERNLAELRQELAGYTRTVGRIEGQIAFEERRLKEEERRAQHEEGQPVPYREAKNFWNELTHILDCGHGNGENVEVLREALRNAQELVRKFVERHLAAREAYEPDTKERDRLTAEKTDAESQVERVQKRIAELEGRVRELTDAIEKNKDESRDLERELFSLMASQTELRATLAALDTREQTLAQESAAFKREIAEGIALIGRAILGYKDYEISEGEVLDLDTGTGEDRSVQLERQHDLEKMKIRLEEMGGASADDITKEYAEVKERDDFLEHELQDLSGSADALRKLIDTLDQELSDKFKQGVKEIDTQFREFFTLMFGGGTAKLKIVAEKKRGALTSMLFGEEPAEEGADQGGNGREEGIEVEVSLPKKRIQNLMMLSGGERALTSIALIFAMSQVNPPPFLILDETDAALDEANSRRYGDMITNLSKRSQLILITHNRETMSRAGVLYGITMGADGVSHILSVKFDEAVAVAK